MKVEPKGFEYDLGLAAGDTHIIVMNFHTSGTPINKASSQFFYTAKVSLSDSDAAAVIRVEPGDVVIQDSGKDGGVNDQVRITLLAAATALPPGEYFQDIQEVDGAEVTTIAEGVLTIKGSATTRIS